MAFAAQDVKHVPAEHKIKVERSKGAGANVYPAIDVNTTSAKTNTFLHKYL